MTVHDIQTDRGNLTLTASARYETEIERVWDLWANPRLLERWWGPPTYPATVTEHDLTPGGIVKYHMTGPEGDIHGGWWKVTNVEPPHSLEFVDGFADEAGEPNDDMPTTSSRVSIVEEAGIVVMTIVTTFSSLEAMEQLVAMGMEEGIRQAMGQIDAILAGSKV